MFKKLLASIGIGSAKVDTLLHTEHLLPGQAFSGEILVVGGNVEQAISGLDLALMTKVKVEGENGDNFVNHMLQNWHISDSFTIAPQQQRRIPFELVLHPETPITQLDTRFNQCQVWLATGLNIDMAIDASDKDPLYIYPNDVVTAFMQAMRHAGYQLHKADVEKGFLNTRQFRSNSGCYQELEYRPGRTSLLGIREVELSFVPEKTVTHVLIELDRAFKGDGYRSISIGHDAASIEAIPQQLANLLK
ncbi:sporulation protein [Shewanella sp. NIFS-20-20]|uniref:sporulation protein n=1 Tax=Shewanella sp. NIFS-20-20 TaxID=2853806 RepID=UPI001C489DC7|nr:sporulation protein [Shewanella sp. NIFS-20-20]MBV7317333.1 sporulation protein [Shewanella sp. NIFS-20-20]